ncbi:hypothetical protein Amal_03701 [Acetobacter malorum]|uniref:Uncharacterized protein n=1 Tax=Acetobacter malorum TaxID=178901 RepID=A0A177G5S3_9PROT|nr:hypothetical protein Amal_03701 [Acetobacter malorum]
MIKARRQTTAGRAGRPLTLVSVGRETFWQEPLIKPGFPAIRQQKGPAERRSGKKFGPRHHHGPAAGQIGLNTLRHQPGLTGIHHHIQLARILVAQRFQSFQIRRQQTSFGQIQHMQQHTPPLSQLVCNIFLAGHRHFGLGSQLTFSIP